MIDPQIGLALLDDGVVRQPIRQQKQSSEANVVYSAFYAFLNGKCGSWGYENAPTLLLELKIFGGLGKVWQVCQQD